MLVSRYICSLLPDSLSVKLVSSRQEEEVRTERPEMFFPNYFLLGSRMEYSVIHGDTKDLLISIPFQMLLIYLLPPNVSLKVKPWQKHIFSYKFGPSGFIQINKS